MNKTSMSETCISSHIFIFPFKWDYIEKSNEFNIEIDKRIDIEKFSELLRKDFWTENAGDLIENIDDEKEKNKKYSEYNYFYNNVRQAIYGRNKTNTERIVKRWRIKGENEQSYYLIKLQNDNEYKLKIKDIRLNIYDTGVGVLSYFLDNYEYENKDDILKINDFGRRLFPPFINSEGKCDGIAKQIELNLPQLSHKEISKFSYKISYSNSPNELPKLILGLLGNKFKCNENIESDTILIKPIIDDRMFVMCNYNNNEIVTDLKQLNEFNNNLNCEFWYKYIFVDTDYLTCQDNTMVCNLLKESTYTRWKEYGTFYGISRYSFNILKLSNAPSYLNDHFETMYYEMVLLALIQRASILRFSDEASRVARLNNENLALKAVKGLQKHYIRFINNIYFREVTAQEQGIEIYDKLIEMMKIERDIKRLGEEIDEINKYSSQIVNSKTNHLLEIITYITATVAICDTVRETYLKFNDNPKLALGIALASSISVSVLILLGLRWILVKVLESSSRIKKIIFWVYFIFCLMLIMG